MRLFPWSKDDARDVEPASKKHKGESKKDKGKSKKDKEKTPKVKDKDQAKVLKEKDSAPKEREKPPKERERPRRDSENPELAGRLREYGENYGLEEDPYLEGLSNAIEEGKNLSVWASNDVMTLMPHPDVESVEGPIYSAMVLIRNVLVFVPVALTWLAVGKATTGFSLYTAKSSAASVVNFLQFWQNGYGVLSKTWTLSHIAEDDFYIIGTVILLTFITPFMNRSAIKKAARFEQDALRERLTLVIEVESFFFDKRRLTPLTIDSSLAQSFERVVESTRNLALASKRIEIGLKALPRQIESGEDSPEIPEPKIFTAKESKKFEPEQSDLSAREKEIIRYQNENRDDPKFNEFEPDEEDRLLNASATLETASKRVDIIAQSLPRRAHARKELQKVEIELGNTRIELAELQGKLWKNQKKAAKEREWRAAKREEERNRVLNQTRTLADFQLINSEAS